MQLRESWLTEHSFSFLGFPVYGLKVNEKRAYASEVWKKRDLSGYLILWGSVPGFVFELFCNSAICPKLIIMQMILAHRDANEVCPVEMQLVIALWMLARFAFIYKFISAFQLPCCVCSLNALDLVVNTLRFSLVLMMK